MKLLSKIDVHVVYLSIIFLFYIAVAKHDEMIVICFAVMICFIALQAFFVKKGWLYFAVNYTYLVVLFGIELWFLH